MSNSTKTDNAKNPLLQAWNTAYGLPPFDQVAPHHFVPAFTQSLAEHLTELNAIAMSAFEPDFDNTLRAFDVSGRLLNRISLLFQ